MVKLNVLLLFIVVLSGCATSNVVYIGVEESQITYNNKEEYLLNNDRDLAIKVKEKIGLTHGSSASYDKLVIIPKESILNAIKSNRIGKYNNEIWPKLSGGIHPSAYKRENVRVSEHGNFIPSEKVSGIPERQNQYIPYLHNGVIYNIDLDRRLSLPNHKKEKTHWWGYPIKATLIIPAVAADIVSLPLFIPLAISSYGLAWAGN